MSGYTRQSTYVDGDTILAEDSNDEFSQLLAAFSNTTGHAHDGTAAEGPVIGLIGDPNTTTPLNKVVVSDLNNRVSFYSDVASASVEQVRFEDGVIYPVTNNDVDFGTASLRFKDGFFSGALNAAGLATLGDITLTAANPEILGGDTDGVMYLSPSTTNALGGNAVFYGDTHATKANDIELRATAGVELHYDDSASKFDFQANAIDTTGAVTFSGGGALTGTWTDLGTVTTVDINGGTADNVVIGGSTPAAATTTTLVANTSLVINGSTALTSIDEDLTSVSASHDTLPTALATKTYVDAQVTASDLDFSADSGGGLSIDLDTEVLTLTGGTGIDTTGLANDVSFAIDSTVATLTGTQTLTNKTINTASNTITIVEADVSDLQSYILAGSTDTLTNKTLTSPVLNGTLTGTAFLDEDNLSSNSDIAVASQQSIKAYVDAQVTAQDLDLISDSGTIAIDLDGETLTVAGGTGLDSSATANTLTLAIDSTVATLTGTQTLTNKTINTASNTITVVEADVSDLQAYILSNSTDTLTSKSIDLASNTLTGTTAQFNTALSDNSFATLAGTETLTNKTLTAPVIDLSTVTSSGDLAIADGGTGSSTAALARTALDVDQAGTAIAMAIALG
jgi:hypothetical protein